MLQHVHDTSNIDAIRFRPDAHPDACPLVTSYDLLDVVIYVQVYSYTDMYVYVCVYECECYKCLNMTTKTCFYACLYTFTHTYVFLSVFV